MWPESLKWMESHERWDFWELSDDVGEVGYSDGETEDED